jgi:hypothetical protein
MVVFGFDKENRRAEGKCEARFWLCTFPRPVGAVGMWKSNAISKGGGKGGKPDLGFPASTKRN